MEKKEGPMESVEVKKISFSILVYNEAASLKSTITSALFTLDKKKLDYEFWVFDNNSNDNTEDIVKSFNHKKINYKKQIKNMGYAYNNFSAVKEPKADLYVIMDGDGQYDPEDIDKFINASKSNDLVIGIRKKRQDSLLRIFMSIFFNVIANLMIKSCIKDINCGYKILSKKLANSLNIKFYYNYINPEIYVFAKKNKFKITSIEINHFPRKYGQSYFNGYLNLIKNIFLMIKYLYDLRKIYVH